mmetsp:Transcript_3948/g.12126  ORF Transcript_3948/g.12126 Transcript_3948/m.12126 type:complete len:605 (+) Transcript_3948:97-1911(+)
MAGEPAYELGAPFEPMSAYEAAFTAMGEELGRGASGVVRRAVRKADGLGVAVKTIDLRALRVMGGFSLSRLRREVEVMLGLRHPNIVELHGAYGNSDGVRLVMELVEGEELFDAILSRGKFSEAEARPIFGALCAAVAYMHGRGVIHRDLKPENVLLEKAKGVKLVDFGLSKLVASHRGGSAARTMVGTPSYLAPEIEEMRGQQRSIDLDAIEEDASDVSAEASPDQARSGTYDAKVDAWSLGVTLYVMLIARFPSYKRTEAGQIAGVDLPLEADALSPAARSLIVRLLAADPRQRLSAAAALKDAWLETAVATMPSLAVAQAAEPAGVESAAVSPAKPAAAVPKHPHEIFCGLASAHASVVAAAALQMPPEMRRAGLVYHERVLASRGLASKLRSTAALVLETLDDLACAVDDRQPAVARDILANIKRWTSDLGAECAKAKNDNLDSMRDLADSTPGLSERDALPAVQHTPSRRKSKETATLDLTRDDDVLELMLPVTTGGAPDDAAARSRDDLAQPHDVAPILKCLSELHVVFSRMELFWSKVEVSLDTILRRNEALDTLVNFADAPRLKTRFDARLSQFRTFWLSLANWQIDDAPASPQRA